jgi:hypothetical protein
VFIGVRYRPCSLETGSTALRVAPILRNTSLTNSLGYKLASAKKVGLERRYRDAQALRGIFYIDAVKVAELHGQVVSRRQLLYDLDQNARPLASLAVFIGGWPGVHGKSFDDGRALIGEFFP